MMPRSSTWRDSPEPPERRPSVQPTPTDVSHRLRDGLARVVVGGERVAFALLVAVLGGGHALIEGVPGTAKTLTVRVLARLLGVSYGRIQFTPDLMPSDVVGTTVFDQRSATFSLRRGPVFAGVLLADEINRTPPKTQAALLEAMEERRVTIDGTTYDLPEPFLVCATQNPIEFEGTYPLPEAQL
ncbi:MAG: AAA family ATPase, partial [Candidatus Eremiobacteraeota bacterium]|nr:AAA family ATPase [Candidatus Eremiobacteraeota bacterium]